MHIPHVDCSYCSQESLSILWLQHRDFCQGDQDRQGYVDGTCWEAFFAAGCIPKMHAVFVNTYNLVQYLVRITSFPLCPEWRINAMRRWIRFMWRLEWRKRIPAQTPRTVVFETHLLLVVLFLRRTLTHAIKIANKVGAFDSSSSASRSQVNVLNFLADVARSKELARFEQRNFISFCTSKVRILRAWARDFLLSIACLATVLWLFLAAPQTNCLKPDSLLMVWARALFFPFTRTCIQKHLYSVTQVLQCAD